MNPITAIADAIKALFTFLSNLTPSQVVKDDNHVIARPRLQQQEKISILNREYQRLKNETELSIAENVSFVDDNLDPQDQLELTSILTAKIYNYRKNHPVVFRKWLKENNIK